MCNEKNNEKEFKAHEAKTIIAKHASKTFRTLEVLMNQLNMMYVWEQLKNQYDNKAFSI